jgi:hypothetical protein
MRITIDIDEAALPEPFRVDGPDGDQGFANIVQFLHEALHVRQLEKACDAAAMRPYCEAFYDRQGWVDAIDADIAARVQLGKLLCDALEIATESGVPG